MGSDSTETKTGCSSSPLPWPWQEEEDLPYEEEIMRNQFSVKCWLRYIEFKQGAPKPRLNQLYERALKLLPCRYEWPSPPCATLLTSCRPSTSSHSTSASAAQGNAVYSSTEAQPLSGHTFPHVRVFSFPARSLALPQSPFSPRLPLGQRRGSGVP